MRFDAAELINAADGYYLCRYEPGLKILRSKLCGQPVVFFLEIPTQQLRSVIERESEKYKFGCIIFSHYWNFEDSAHVTYFGILKHEESSSKRSTRPSTELNCVAPDKSFQVLAQKPAAH